MQAVGKSATVTTGTSTPTCTTIAALSGDDAVAECRCCRFEGGNRVKGEAVDRFTLRDPYTLLERGKAGQSSVPRERALQLRRGSRRGRARAAEPVRQPE